MLAEFITHRDSRWANVLRACAHDCYHLPEYAELAAAEEGAVPMAFYAEDESGGTCLIPLLIRALPSVLRAPRDWYDGISPYGYSGILLSGPAMKWCSIMEAFRAAAKAKGLVTAFLRLHPLLPMNPDALEPFGRLVRHGRTVYVNLSEPPAQIWRQVSTNHRRNITKLLQAGFRWTLDEWSRYRDFIAVYYDTMHRVGASKTYLFSEEYFEALCERLGGRLHLVCVLDPKDEVAAAGLFIASGSIVQYHLGGTAATYLAQAPSKLMMDGVWRWAHEQGYAVFHLGGGVGGAEDSLFHFKAGFSPLRGEFFTYRMVVDEEKQAVLDRAARALRGPTAEAETTCDFFPAYRRLDEAVPTGRELRPAV